MFSAVQKDALAYSYKSGPGTRLQSQRKKGDASWLRTLWAMGGHVRRVCTLQVGERNGPSAPPCQRPERSLFGLPRDMASRAWPRANQFPPAEPCSPHWGTQRQRRTVTSQHAMNAVVPLFRAPGEQRSDTLQFSTLFPPCVRSAGQGEEHCMDRRCYEGGARSPMGSAQAISATCTGMQMEDTGCRSSLLLAAGCPEGDRSGSAG